ncbi:MAG: Gfo/Idh/MocA family oxidoreductase, partial [Acidobacteria bacterium]|nr:Gfo/Idh/MocA family oxidoreductase [Acidobacteriota bacterium]
SDKITLASIGLGFQGTTVTMSFLARPDVQVVAVCDPERMSRGYVEWGRNALLNAERRLLGAGHEKWGEKDLVSEGPAWLIPGNRSSHGTAGREPAQRLVEAYYSSRKETAYKGCNAYRDFRELLDKQKDLDAVYVATPDHWHASISIAAMLKRKHVLCQKPMTHTIGEARRMAQVARETKVATAVPVNNPSSEGSRAIREWIEGGGIGKVREVHNWSSRPNCPQGVERPKETHPVPEGLDWDLWLGPSPARPYNPAYHPFLWRGWYDFGTGSVGNMGSYSFSGMFKILDLTPPVAAEACASGFFDASVEAREETYPRTSIIHLDFPARGARPPVRISWYEGGLRPPRPAGLLPEDDHFFQPGGANEGTLYEGDKGFILADFNGNNPRFYPQLEKPQVARQRNDPAIDQWIAACKGGPPALTNFELQSPVTEAYLLGCLAQRLPGERLLWDSANLRITNSERANRHVNPPYRPAYQI